MRGTYAKAAIGPLLPGRPDELPDERKEREVEIDRDHLAEYARVCEFRVGDRLPATYPHVLAFPLSMEIMTSRRFPFALLGLVHVGNRIEQRRPLTADERLAISVWTEDLRPHRRGKQFDVVAEARASGDLAWVSRSTYLRRGGGDGKNGDGARNCSDTQEPPAPAAIWRVPGNIGRRYAGVSGDHNPIHLNPLTARLFGFPGMIAHGMWMKARCLAALEGRLADSFAVEVEFRRPLGIPGKAGFAARDSDFALTTPDGEKPHLLGKVE
ncbi:MAG TPA: MaoC/PaaZ C-terminal domain-containing protein [Thermoleophilaceae bacterium]|nr:MaoC/PaaZ C-terminal domain-containing protein [Thermoleophilaceae bacterium]